MKDKTQKVLQQAFELSEEDRLHVIEQLLCSLDDGRTEESIDEEWAEEIRRRSQEIEAASTKTLTWSQVKKLAHDRIRKNV
ncbi:addiction module protein [candidate division KSB1 bacterium]|nr:addiction module protein [candidate division KSB1 bacterium]NIR69490.1 addiction module protein [candidate division KSB1 bacterium]NIS22840.1 addiction module protein [candidate division KSB1 bacterium]NIT69679.1 addiction module protein [candidate division KSB1 bacterium]NIU23349.1 addiction module protein [candidate division KSB1 bacterium]